MKTTTHRRNASIAVVSALALTAFACQAKNEPAPAATPAPTRAPEPAMVRAIHAIPGGPVADLYADDAKTFAGLAYKAVTGYERVDERQVTFRLRLPSAPTEALAENREMLSGKGHYTVIAMPGERGEGGELKILTDAKEASTDGQARVRVVNAVPDLKEIEIGFKGAKDPLVTGLNSADDVGYRDAVPGKGTFEVRDSAKKRVVAQLADITLTAGHSYTVLVVGRAAGTPKAEVLVVEDNPAVAPAGDAPAPPPVASPSATPNH